MNRVLFYARQRESLLLEQTGEFGRAMTLEDQGRVQQAEKMLK